MLAQETVEGGNPKGIKMLKKYRSQNKAWQSKYSTQLLRSWPEPRGLHPVGALARPHREENYKKTYQNGTLQVARPLHLGLGEGLKPGCSAYRQRLTVSSAASSWV